MLWFLVGIILCVTIIGIPFGLQCFKIAELALVPFGRRVTIGSFGAGGLIGNILWILFFGWEICLAHLFFGILLCITIVGIPFGQQHFKLAQVALVPFGSRVEAR